MNPTNHQNQRRSAIVLVSSLALAAAAWGQQAPTAPAQPPATTNPRPAATTVVQTSTSTSEGDNEPVVQLTPFEVSSARDTGYGAATTLAGNRLNSELRDLGNSISVITPEFLRDIGATNNETLLQYTLGTEVGNIQGNFAGVGDSAQLNESGFFRNPNQNTRVRGLSSADNTRDFFKTDIPWEGYSVDRVDLQRGPNSILFGQGSPAGIINTGMKQAGFKNSNETEVRFGSWGSYRGTLDINRVVLKDQLAVRLIGLYNQEQFKQDPAFNNDHRLYAATRYEPAFLKKGVGRTVLKANAEWGKISSNRPRSLPPGDAITPWFKSGTYQGRYTDNQPRTFNYLNRETFNPFQLQDDNTGRPNHGQQRPSINGGANAGQPNPAYNPWVGNFAQIFGGPVAYFDGVSPNPAYWMTEIRSTRGIGPTGAVDGGLGFAFHRMGSIAKYADFARAARLPNAEFGVYKNVNLTDPSIYDFYNNLLDGGNKNEWQNFRTYNVSLAQTFLKDKLGFEASYNNETYRNGQLTMISDDRQVIYVDLMSVFPDGTPAGRNGEPFQDGTANPNVGRPFVSDSWQFGNNSYKAERESGRFTAFVTHNFEREGARNWLTRLAGRHTLTGLYGQDRTKTDERQWQRYAVLDPAYRTFTGAAPATRFTDNLLAVNSVAYLGPLWPAGLRSPAREFRALAPPIASRRTARSAPSTPPGPIDPASIRRLPGSTNIIRKASAVARRPSRKIRPTTLAGARCRSLLRIPRRQRPIAIC